MMDIKKEDGVAYELTTKASFASCLHSQEKKIKTLFTGVGRSILEKSMPSVLRPRYPRPRAQFLLIRTSRPVNNIYVYYCIQHDDQAKPFVKKVKFNLTLIMIVFTYLS